MEDHRESSARLARNAGGGTVMEDSRERFSHLLLAEWTKLRSVPRWMMTLAAAVGLTILMGLLAAQSSSSVSVEAGPIEEGDPGSAGPPDAARGAEGGEGGLRQEEPIPDGLGPPGSDVLDQFYFVHQSLTGDSSIVARVASQANSHEWARAGVMAKERLEWGAPYAALAVTPEHGVRLQSEFGDDVAGSDSAAPRWLRLTRSGDSVTGYESSDGSDWSEVGTVELDELPRTVEVGLFVNSPEEVRIERQFGSESIGAASTDGEATFDNVSVEAEGATGASAGQAWSEYNSSRDGMGNSAESGGVFTVRGSGDIGERPTYMDDDLVEISLIGALTGLLAIVALGVLFITSEYKRGMIRTTFAARPDRGHVLAAKAVVLGGVTFLAGLVASAVSFLITQPILRSNGFDPPEYPELSLFDSTVLRAVVGTAAVMALVAVLGLSVGTVLRRSAGAIVLVIVPLILPGIIGTGLPVSAARWLTRLTPSAGFAIQETVERYDTAISPLAGFAVLCAYTVLAFAAAVWMLDRRDA